MARIVLFIAVFLSFTLSIISAAERGDALAKLEGKLVGTWAGRGPCDGRMIVNSDGTFKRELHGPSGNNSSGKWKLNWDALPPTLTFECSKSDDLDYVGEVISWKLVKLDDATFKIKRDGLTALFKRVDKDDTSE